jgi:hypothetical protein
MKIRLELRSGFAALAVATCALLLAPLAASAEEVTFTASLSGPPASGDPDGRGEATLVLNPETNEVRVRLTYSNIARPTALHIRRGETGMDGNIMVPIEIDSDDGSTLTGSRVSAKPDAISMILTWPGDYYLVVITPDRPVGALRGLMRRQ